VSDVWLDFNQIKASVSLEHVFHIYHLHFPRSGPGSLRGRCPLPTHQSKQSRWSFSADLYKDLWACHSESCIQGRNGRIGGDVIEFVSLMESCSIRDAAVKLQQWFSTDFRLSIKGVPVYEEDERELTPLSFKLMKINQNHQYFQERGISRETTVYFGIGHYYGTGYFSNRIVIPIHDDSGTLVAYSGRAIDESLPKYKLPRGFPKSAVLFNLHRVQNSTTVIVVEGFFDCMKVWQAGFENVVALMGCSLSDKQSMLLVNRFQFAILMLDADPTGQRATANILQQLTPQMYVRVVTLPQGKQPDQLSDDEIQSYLSFFRK